MNATVLNVWHLPDIPDSQFIRMTLLAKTGVGQIEQEDI